MSIKLPICLPLTFRRKTLGLGKKYDTTYVHYFINLMQYPNLPLVVLDCYFIGICITNCKYGSPSCQQEYFLVGRISAILIQLLMLFVSTSTASEPTFFGVLQYHRRISKLFRDRLKASEACSSASSHAISVWYAYEEYVRKSTSWGMVVPWAGHDRAMAGAIWWMHGRSHTGYGLSHMCYARSNARPEPYKGWATWIGIGLTHFDSIELYRLGTPEN